ncbi:MAG: hypothetical protein AAF847_09190 [Bacteroidota bacterium]
MSAFDKTCRSEQHVLRQQGQITGGGGGGNQTQELSNGWLLTISSSKLLDVNLDESLEEGTVSDIVVKNDSLTLVGGVDEMLERVIDVF